MEITRKLELDDTQHSQYTDLQIVESLRAAEIITRERRSSSWIHHDIIEIKKKSDEFFFVMEQNSKGRYSIVCEESDRGENSYLINCRIRGNKGDDPKRIFMPPEFQDVFRDLIANARKYSEPGAKIGEGTTISILVPVPQWRKR